MSDVSIRALFDQAMALPEAERAAFVDARCADPTQRERLHRLLRAARETALDAPIARDPAQWARDIGDPITPPPRGHGQTVGPFEIEAQIGEGGSARVYRASRVIEGVRQTVALKVLRFELGAGNARQQFDRERLALVRLNHPGIAKLVDAGVSARGEAYIALEYVDGKPLIEHARAHDLSPRERLRLLVAVARVVSAAHRSLIVHRDLKPGNVLITRDGEVKLLDFGIAKLLEPMADAVTHTQTQTQYRAFTPAYAAPEQRDGGVITTATDVYALGVLMGELLTGERTTHAQLAPEVASDTTITDAGAFASTTLPWRDDLKNILRKATETAPEDRYETAAAFADDVQRLLDGQPVNAHPPSTLYRARKFVARHRGGILVTALIAIGMLTLFAAAVWQRGEAVREAEHARAVSGFLVGLFSAAEDRLPRAQRPTIEDLIGLAHEKLTDNTRLDEATRAEVAFTLGEVSRLGSAFADAERLYDTAARSLALGPPNRGLAARLSLSRAMLLQQRGRYREASSALTALQPLLIDQPTALRVQALDVEAAVQHSLGKPEQAIVLTERALQLARAAEDIAPIDLHRAWLAHGGALCAAEHFNDAVRELEPALARWEALSLPHDSDYMDAAESLATALHMSGHAQDSLRRFENLLEEQHRIYREPHDQIAKTLRNYAVVLAANGRINEALAAHHRSIDMLRAVVGEDHELLVAGHLHLALTLAGARRLPESVDEYRAALAICARARIDNLDCARAHGALSMSLYRDGQYDQARAEAEASLQQLRDALGDEHYSVATARTVLCNVLSAQGEHAAAIAQCQQAIDLLRALHLDDTRDMALTRNSLAQSLINAKKPEVALPEIDAAIELFDRVAATQLARRVQMRAARARTLLDLHRPDEARETAQAAVDLGADPHELSSRARAILREALAQPELYPGLD